MFVANGNLDRGGQSGAPRLLSQARLIEVVPRPFWALPAPAVAATSRIPVAPAAPGFNAHVPASRDSAPATTQDAPGTAQAVLYLTADQVDQPAMPVGEWLFALRNLPIHSPLRIEVQVWISATGSVEHWELAGDSASDAMALAVVQPLGETMLNPALKDGLPVASVRLLEFTVERTEELETAESTDKLQALAQ